MTVGTSLQSTASTRRVAAVMSTDGSDHQERSSINVVVTALAKLAWVSGQNVELAPPSFNHLVSAGKNSRRHIQT